MAELNQNGANNQERSFSNFVNENKRLVVLIAILIVLIIVALFINFVLFSPDTPALDEEAIGEEKFEEEGFENDGEAVEVLPKLERDVDEEFDVELSRDPFSRPIELDGTVEGGNGNEHEGGNGNEHENGKTREAIHERLPETN